MVAMIKDSGFKKFDSLMKFIYICSVGGFLIMYLIVNLDSQLQCIDINVCHLQYNVNNMHNDSICADFINSFISIMCYLVETCNNLFEDIDPFHSPTMKCICFDIESNIGYVIAIPFIIAAYILAHTVHLWISLTFLSDNWVKNLMGASFIITPMIMFILNDLERKPKENEKKIK